MFLPKPLLAFFYLKWDIINLNTIELLKLSKKQIENQINKQTQRKSSWTCIQSNCSNTMIIDKRPTDQQKAKALHPVPKKETKYIELKIISLSVSSVIPFHYHWKTVNVLFNAFPGLKIHYKSEGERTKRCRSLSLSELRFPDNNNGKKKKLI